VNGDEMAKLEAVGTIAMAKVESRATMLVVRDTEETQSSKISLGTRTKVVGSQNHASSIEDVVVGRPKIVISG
jgi:hypothetical protein